MGRLCYDSAPGSCCPRKAGNTDSSIISWFLKVGSWLNIANPKLRVVVNFTDITETSALVAEFWCGHSQAIQEQGRQGVPRGGTSTGKDTEAGRASSTMRAQSTQGPEAVEVAGQQSGGA